MTPDIVVDIGNSRMKWGWYDPTGAFRHRSLDADNPAEWTEALTEIDPRPQPHWAVASVHPTRLDRLRKWISDRQGSIRVFDDPAMLPIRIGIRDPRSVGIDRLLGAIAANARRQPDCVAVTVDAGTAVTVNLIDSEGVFRGGAILPGFQLMAESLHWFTAKLPFVPPDDSPTEFPGEDTANAIRLGIRCAIEGAVTKFLERLDRKNVEIFYTGGYGSLLLPADDRYCVPALNLEGLRIAAEAQP
jgi:type III pantothenate kinase